MPLSDPVLRADGPDVFDADQLTCPACNGGLLAPGKVDTALWVGDRLVLVEDVPALICQSCGEQYTADETVMRLDFLRGEGFPPDQAAREVTVQVYRYDAGADAESGADATVA